MSLVLRLPRKRHLARSSAHACHRFRKCYKTITFCSLFDKVHNPLRLPGKTTSECPNALRTRQFFTLLTSKCASRHNGVHLFDISTSKSAPSPSRLLTLKCALGDNGVRFFDMSTSKNGPTLMCFVHFDFQMCFAPTVCTFSTSQLPKVLRRWCALYILTWKCASRHNGVHSFISHLTTWLRARRFSKLTFRPSGATNHRKNRVSRLSSFFIYLHLFSSHVFYSLFFFLRLFFSLILPTFAFTSVHIVGNF